MAQLETVPYDGPVVQSQKTANIQLRLGPHVGVDGTLQTSTYAVGAVINLPVTVKSNEKLHFNKNDQALFLQNLKDEITRLGIVKISTQNQPNLDIEVVFNKTTHVMPSHRYILDVSLIIQSGFKKVVYLQNYLIDSEENVTSMTKMSTNAGEGKTRAAKALLNKIILSLNNYLKPPQSSDQ